MGETVSALTSLEELMLNGNQLITLPNEVGDLQRLEKFDMANNRLQALPRAIGRLTRVILNIFVLFERKRFVSYVLCQYLNVYFQILFEIITIKFYYVSYILCQYSHVYFIFD